MHGAATRATYLSVEPEDSRQFDLLLAELSTQFAAATSLSIDSVIIDAQRHIGQTLELDRSILVQLQGLPGDERFVVTHAWNSQELGPFPGFAVKDLVWMSAKMLSGEVVRLESINDLPDEAVVEKQVAHRFGPKSNVTFPLRKLCAG